MKTSTTTKLIQLFEEANDLEPLITVQMMQAFMIIAEANEQRKELHTKELEKRMGLYSSTSSRTIGALGLRKNPKTGKQGGRAGLELISTEPNPADKRANLVFLTPKGSAFNARMKKIIES